MLTTYDGPEVVAGPGSNVCGAHIYVDDVEVLWIGLSWCMVGPGCGALFVVVDCACWTRACCVWLHGWDVTHAVSLVQRPMCLVASVGSGTPLPWLVLVFGRGDALGVLLATGGELAVTPCQGVYDGRTNRVGGVRGLFYADPSQVGGSVSVIPGFHELSRLYGVQPCLNVPRWSEENG